VSNEHSTHSGQVQTSEERVAITHAYVQSLAGEIDNATAYRATKNKPESASDPLVQGAKTAGGLIVGGLVILLWAFLSFLPFVFMVWLALKVIRWLS
jgi:hypothetical protein